MKILLLSDFPQNYDSYDRKLRSKINEEIKKGIEVQQYLYVFKGQKSLRNVNWFEIEMPFYWDNIFKKVAGAFFIFINNVKLIKNNYADLVMLDLHNSIYDFPKFFYPLLFPKKNFFIETTTPSVSKSKIKRRIIDFLLTLTLKPYKKIGMSNIECKTVFKIPEKKVIYTQIGFPEYSFNIKNFQSLSLIYLGTLFNRDVWKTVIGIKIFTLKHPDVKITYDIIGGAKEDDVKLLKEAIQKESLNEIICYHGYQSTEFVNEIFNKCNIGIAFVPMTKYYDNMSITKAVEYLLAGMPIIATRTSYATGILKDGAGVLCDDTPEDFARALEEIYFDREKYDSQKIRDLYKNYSMSYLIKNDYIPILKTLI